MAQQRIPPVEEETLEPEGKWIKNEESRDEKALIAAFMMSNEENGIKPADFHPCN